MTPRNAKNQMPVSAVDQTARNALSAHEDLCSLRYKGIDEKLIGAKASITNIYRHLWVAAGAVIAAQWALLLMLAGKLGK